MIETGDVAARPQVRDERAVDAREIGVGRAPHRRPRRSLRLRLQARKEGRKGGRKKWMGRWGSDWRQTTAFFLSGITGLNAVINFGLPGWDYFSEIKSTMKRRISILIFLDPKVSLVC